MVPTFQYPRHRTEPPVFSAIFLCWSATQCLCQNVVLLASVSCEQRGENRMEPRSGCMVGDQTLPNENAAGASLLQLQCAAKHFHGERQCLMTTFLSAYSELPFVDVEDSVTIVFDCLEIRSD
ncbi:uncharacterized protein LOC142329242 [Lycorma delicatula]|uniref:uncharacterized protein LOC142329242 n=1 Tax=Lycorma delicatula TaxID=130591 RepID=UPI003F51806B